jgi:predicted nucleic acid-binding protein
VRTAIDTNIISALWSKEPSASQITQLLNTAYQAGGLVICAAVYAELHAYPRVKPAFIDKFLSDTHISVEYSLSKDVWDLVASAYASYAQERRQQKTGQAKRLLVDFMVGAHALKEADQLLTLDRSRYNNAYPNLKIIP